MIAREKNPVKAEKKTENMKKPVKKEEKRREIAIPGEKIISGRDYLPGEGTRRDGEDILASRFGLADVSDRLVKVIPLSGVYIPRRGNIVIGRVDDVSFNGWIMDIKAPHGAFLMVSECPMYVKGDLKEYYDIGDVLACKVHSVKQKGIDLTIKGRGLGKLSEGMIIHINPNKVPRVIGREGSMIKLIKEKTGCSITVGQNGVVWIKGDKIENELKAKEAIMFVVNKSFIEGLTDKVEKFFDKKMGGKKK